MAWPRKGAKIPARRSRNRRRIGRKRTQRSQRRNNISSSLCVLCVPSRLKSCWNCTILHYCNAKQRLGIPCVLASWRLCVGFFMRCADCSVGDGTKTGFLLFCAPISAFCFQLDGLFCAFRAFSQQMVLRCFQWNSRSGPPNWCNDLFFNPKGIVSLSPASARFREGLRWVATRGGSNPERVEYQRLMEEMQPFQGW